jgi:hypothetical protein
VNKKKLLAMSITSLQLRLLYIRWEECGKVRFAWYHKAIAWPGPPPAGRESGDDGEGGISRARIREWVETG